MLLHSRESGFSQRPDCTLESSGWHAVQRQAATHTPAGRRQLTPQACWPVANPAQAVLLGSLT